MKLKLLSIGVVAALLLCALTPMTASAATPTTQEATLQQAILERVDALLAHLLSLFQPSKAPAAAAAVPTQLQLSAPAKVVVGQSVTFTGTLTSSATPTLRNPAGPGAPPVAGAKLQLEFYVGGGTWDYTGSPVVTNSHGVATVTLGSPTAATNQFRFIYAGNADYAPSTSNVVTVVTLAAVPTQLQLSAPAYAVVGQLVPYTGWLYNTLGTSMIPVAGAKLQLEFYVGGGTWDYTGSPAVTNSHGEASVTLGSPTAGTDQIRFIYEGNATYAPATSNVVTVVTLGAKTTLTIQAPTSIEISQSINITGTLLDHNGAGIVGATITLQYTGSDRNPFTNMSSTTTAAGGVYHFNAGMWSPIGNVWFRTTYAGNATNANAMSNVAVVRIYI